MTAVVMVGGTCAGKSTLAHSAANHPDLADRVIVVPRCSTRPPRRGDGADGVTALGWVEFEERIAVGAFLLSWERQMRDDTVIGYGCLPADDDRLPILMAGHGVYSNPDSVRPRDALNRALLVGVAAPAEVRAERLRKRNPDMVALGPEAIGVLLAHDDGAMADHVDLLVANHGECEPFAVGDMVELLRILVRGG
jgi:ribose 1,5-bisphosphokinase PhnN